MTQTIEQLQAKVAELEEEIERLRADNIAFARNLKGKSATTGATYEHICTQLAAEQLNNKLLRDALEFFFPDWKTYDHLSWKYKAKEALSTPISTEALDAYVAEKVKDAKAEVLDQVRHFKRVREQRDLAVKALEWAADVLPPNDPGGFGGCDCPVCRALEAIKESEWN